MVFIGSFFEGESVVVMASFLAYQGILDPVGVGFASFLGSFASDQVLFVLGRRYANTALVQRMANRRGFAMALRLIETHPVKFILTFRFLYGLRIASPMAVGMSKLSSNRYLVLNTVAAIVWAVIFTTLGYLFGQTIESVLGGLKAFETTALAAIAIGVAITLPVVLITKWRKSHPPKDAA